MYLLNTFLNVWKQLNSIWRHSGESILVVKTLSTSGFSSKLPSLAFFVVLHYNIVIIDKTKNEVKILDITIPADA